MLPPPPPPGKTFPLHLFLEECDDDNDGDDAKAEAGESKKEGNGLTVLRRPGKMLILLVIVSGSAMLVRKFGECYQREATTAFFAAGINAISVIYVGQKVAKVGQLTMAAAHAALT